VLIPKTIPVFNYAQSIALGADPAKTLSTLDADWARLAFRAPVKKETEK
jgi:raffinose/stachyose/melibiose transport system substrate-binding protein